MSVDRYAYIDSQSSENGQTVKRNNDTSIHHHAIARQHSNILFLFKFKIQNVVATSLVFQISPVEKGRGGCFKRTHRCSIHHLWLRAIAAA